MTSSTATSTWCFDSASTASATASSSAMWPSASGSGSGVQSVGAEFGSLSLQDGQSTPNTAGNTGGWPPAGSEAAAAGGGDPQASQRPNNLGSLASFGGNGGNGSAAQSGTPSSAQPQTSNPWSSPFMPHGAGGWNATAGFSQSQDAQDASAGWNQRPPSGRSTWIDGSKSGELGMPSPTGAQPDAFGNAAASNSAPQGSALGTLSVQTNQSGTANGGPPTNASNGQMTAGGSFIRKYPRVAFEDLDESTQRLINTHDGWGRVPVDQKSGWNVEAIMEQRNRLVEQLEREAEQRAGASAVAPGPGPSAAASTGPESNIWTNEPNTGTNIWEQSRDPAGPAAQSGAPFWAGTNSARPNAFGNDQAWRGTWDGRSQPPAEPPALHRSTSSTAAPSGGNGSSRGLQHWNSTSADYHNAAQRPAGPPQRGPPANTGFGFSGGAQSGGQQADFSSQNFGQPGSIGVWGEDDGGTGTAQWGANEAQPSGGRNWNANGPARTNPAASQASWQAAGSQPATPMAGQFAQQGPFAAGPAAGAQPRKPSGWNERAGSNGDKNVDDGTNLWGQRSAQAPSADWGNSTETGVWDAAGTPTAVAAAPKRSETDWDSEQPGSATAGRGWGAQDTQHESHFGEWPGASNNEQPPASGGDASWGRSAKPVRSQFPPGAASQQNAAGPGPAGSNFDQSVMAAGGSGGGGGGGYQRAKLLTRLTSQGFSREDAQAALIRNNMDYDRTLSELNRQRIQSGIPPMANTNAPVRPQHDNAFGTQFDPSLTADPAMLLADLMHKQTGAGAPNNAAFLNNSGLFNQQQLAALAGVGGVGASANALAVQQKLLASGVQVTSGAARGPAQSQQPARMPMSNSAQNNLAQQLALVSNLQQPAAVGSGAAPNSAAHLQAFSQLPPAHIALVQQYLKLNAQLQQLQQQRATTPNVRELNSYIEKMQAQLKFYEQQLQQMQAQQRFAPPTQQQQQQQQKQSGAQQSASRLNQWIGADAQGIDPQAIAASSSSFAGLADSIPEFVPGKPWPGAQYARDVEPDPNAGMVQQRMALAARQQQPQQPQQPQNATTYLLLRNVTLTTDMSVLRQVASQFGKVTNFVPVPQLAICVIAYATRADAEKARNGLIALTTRGIAMELLTDPELTRTLQQAAAAQAQAVAGVARAPGADRTGTPTGSADSGLLPNGLLNS